MIIMPSLKCAIVSLGSVSSQWTAKALRNYFDEVDELDIRKIEVNLGSKEGEILVEGTPIKKYDCIYVKGSFRYATLSQSLVTLLPPSVYTPISAHAFTIGHDKLLTQLELQRRGIPMPKTYQAASPSAAKKILAKVNYPIIMKFPHGTQGKGVLVADSYPSASSMLDALSSLRQPFLIQEYVDTNGVDIRAIVVGDKVVAAMKRKAVSGEMRANIHQGGLGEAVELDARTKKVAVATARAIGAEICAVDILESVKGPVVIEANLSPGLQGITKATKVDVADKIAKYLFKRTQEFKSGNKKKDAGKILTDLGIKNGMGSHDIIEKVTLRDEKIVLPPFVTRFGQFEEGEEIIINVKPGSVTIKRV
ncbi:RimK family alpha-L-glutamate ligase [Candidatus Woesearchaeota archaeon]|nr:MAG: RimK family alpha-L-glutamate ligase [Candidatus Woesearchaeota archaeon]